MKRIHRFTLAILLAPALAGAQQTVQPQSAANAVSQSFKATGTRYGNLLVQAFDSIPESKYSYKPTPVQQSIGYIAQHLEEANYGICSAIAGTKRTLTAKDSLADTVKAKWPKDTLVARLKSSLAYCDDVIAKSNDAQLADQIAVGPAGSGRTVLRSRYLIIYVTDLAEHYAQLASYMRLNGMVPPSALPRPSR
jgi:uncharacterized damage-inducible protein DinB